jgi:hypothetical protein
MLIDFSVFYVVSHWGFYRKKKRAMTRQESFESINRTMIHYEKITTEEEKKYAYKSWNSKMKKSGDDALFWHVTDYASILAFL